MTQVTQAVIFCGGRGARLGSITKKIPKPMVMVSGKPFLEHLIIQLKKNGIKNFLLLTGYKHNIIKRYFKNGNALKVKITYSYNSPETKTGLRLYSAKKLIHKRFILLYSDNYTSINIYKLNKNFEKNKKKILLVLVKKNYGNCSYNSVTQDSKYFLKRSKKNSFVEIGYMIIEQNLLKKLGKNNLDFSEYLKFLSDNKKISAFVQKDFYLSIGDKKRLLETSKYFANNKYILIDRDGVLNINLGKGKYVTNLNEIKINMPMLSKLKKISNYFKFICISNQAGIALRLLNKLTLKKINKYIAKYFKSFGVDIVDFYISPDHYLSNSFYRKPNPGLFLKASKDYKFLLDKTLYIGDDKRDVKAAYNANTYIYYVGKDSLNKFERKKYKNILINNNLNKIINKKKRNDF